MVSVTVVVSQVVVVMVLVDVLRAASVLRKIEARAARLVLATVVVWEAASVVELETALVDSLVAEQ